MTSPGGQVRRSPDPDGAAGGVAPQSGAGGVSTVPAGGVSAEADGGVSAADGGVSAEAAGDEAPKRVFAPDFLTELFRNPLEPGYADAAARKAREGDRTGVRKWLTSSSALVTLIALGILLTVAYRQTVADEPARAKARDDLVQQVQSRRTATDDLQKRADQLGDDVSRLRDQQLGDAEAARLRALAASSGLGPVTGDGARITVGDGPMPENPVTNEKDMLAQVKDSDLQLAVNALWSQGAEAIAINGRRLTATSTIRQAGEAIMVDLQPVTTPYVIVAIGPGDLAKAFRDSYAGAFFKALNGRYAMPYDARAAKNLTLDAATEFTLRWAEPSTPPPAPSPSHPASPSGSVPASGAGGSAPSVPVTEPSEGGR